jgi:uncharacterized protein YjbI with pentapeptide repeats
MKNKDLQPSGEFKPSPGQVYQNNSQNEVNYDSDLPYRKYLEFSIGHGYNTLDVIDDAGGVLSGKSFAELWRQPKSNGFILQPTGAYILPVKKTESTSKTRSSLRSSRDESNDESSDLSETPGDDDGESINKSAAVADPTSKKKMSFKEKLKAAKEKKELKKQRKPLRSSFSQQDASEDESSYQTSASEDEDTETRTVRRKFSGFFSRGGESNTEESGGGALRKKSSSYFSKDSESDADDSKIKTPRIASFLSPRNTAKKFENKDLQDPPLGQRVYCEESLDKTLHHEFLVAEIMMGLSGSPENFVFKRVAGNRGLQYEIERVGVCPEFIEAIIEGKLQVKNAALCSSVMDEEIDPVARANLLKKLDHGFLKKFFQTLSTYGVATREGLPEEMETKRLAMRKALIKKSNITLRELHDSVDPEVSAHYKKNSEQYSDANDRYNGLLVEVVKSPSEKISAGQQSEQYMKAFNQKKLIGKARKALIQGDVAPLEAIIGESGKEEVINGIKYQVRIKESSSPNSKLVSTIRACLNRRSFKPKRLDLSHIELLENDLRNFLGGRERQGDNLTYLNISSCKADPTMLIISLSLYSGLKTLIMRDTPFASLEASLEGLTTLDLSGTKVTNAIFAQLTTRCPNLRGLKLSNTRITALNSLLPNLTHLDLSDSEVDETIFAQIFDYCPKIRYLRISSSKILTINISEMRLFLAELNVSGCKNLLSIESNSFKNVKKYTERKEQQKEAFAFRVLRANHCPALKIIDLDYATAEGLTALYANDNGAMISVNLGAGKPLPALNILEVYSEQLQTLTAKPLKILRFKACSPKLVALDEVLNLCLLRQAMHSRDTDAWRILELLIADFVPWAIKHGGESVFHHIRARDFDGTNINLSGASFEYANLTGAKFDGADLTGCSFRNANLTDASFGQLPSIMEHEAAITAFARSKDGKLFASADQKGQIIIWSEGKILDKIGLDGGISTLAFSPDGKRLALAGTCHDNKAGRNMGSKKIAEMLKEINPGTKKIVGDEDIYLTLIYDIKPGSEAPAQLVSCFYTHSKEIKVISYSDDGKYLITASEDGKIKILDTTSGKMHRVIERAEAGFEVLSLAIHPNNMLLAAGYVDGVIIIWNFLQNRIVETLAEPNKAHETLSWDKKSMRGVAVNCLAWSKGKKIPGHYLVSGGDDKTIKIWTKPKPTLKPDVKSKPETETRWVCERTLQSRKTEQGLIEALGHESLPSCVVIDPACKYIFSADDRGDQGRHAVMVWKFDTGELVRIFGHRGGIKAIDIEINPLGADGSSTWTLRTGEVKALRNFIFRDDGSLFQVGRNHLSKMLKATGINLKGVRGLSDDQLAVLEEAGAEISAKSLPKKVSINPRRYFAGKAGESDGSGFSSDDDPTKGAVAKVDLPDTEPGELPDELVAAPLQPQ